LKPAERKQKILSSIIESYIKTGEPVGSKTLQSAVFSGVSSATLRNDMAELTDSGLLFQPHTSAGRVPTLPGLHSYIDSLENVQPTPHLKAYIDDLMSGFYGSPEEVLKKAEEALFKVTGCVGISSTPPYEGITIHKLKLVQIGKYTAMLLLITSVGMVNAKIFRCEYTITPDILRVFEQALNHELAGVALSSVCTSFLQTTACNMGEIALLLAPCLVSVLEISEESRQINIGYSGADSVLSRISGDVITAGSLFMLLNQKKLLLNLLLKNRHGTTVYFGGEEQLAQLSNIVLICSRYKINSKPAGGLALAGSLRTDYRLALAALKYTADITGSLIEDTIAA
jgi:heat-inducible transcriptional repressor